MVKLKLVPTSLAKRPPQVKESLNAMIESIFILANTILNKDYLYTQSELELANNLRLAIIFYKAQEYTKNNQ